MRKTTFLIFLILMLAFAVCDSREEFNGIALPFSLDDIEIIELIHHTGDPQNAQQKWITDSEDINYIFTMLSSDILVGSGSVDADKQTNTLYITFHRYGGTGYTVKYECFGVKKGIISLDNTPEFSYFTSADIGWIWGQLARDYEAKDISIVEGPYATEAPTVEEQRTEEDLLLEELVRSFLAAKEKDFQSEEHLSLAEFFVPDVRDTLETQLNWKVFRFEKLVRYSIREKILWETFAVYINDIELNGNEATVTSYEQYEYELSYSDGFVSSRGTNLTFNCRKIDDTWYIVSVETDNEDIKGLVKDVPADELPELAGVS